MPWSTSALLLLLGIAAGPYGLNLLSTSVLLLLDPLIVMALAMLGVFIGLAIDAHRPQPGSLTLMATAVPTSPAVLAVLAGIAMAAIRDPSPLAAALMA